MTTKSKIEPQTSTSAQPGVAASQISAKAQREIDMLRVRLLELSDEQQSLTQEREQLLTDGAQRADHRLQVRTGVQLLETAYQDAKAYARIAQDTAGEAQAIREVNRTEKAFLPARAHQEKVEAQYDALDTTTAARLQAIDERLLSSITERDAAQSKLMEVGRVRDRAVQELGQHTYDVQMAEYQVYEDKLEALRQEMLEIQIERQQMIERASEVLQPWPEVQQKFKFGTLPTRPDRTLLEHYNDPTYRVLQSAINYMDTLLTDGRYLPTSMNGPAASKWYPNWLNALEISHEVLWTYENLSGSMPTLKAHRQNLSEMLTQYVATKR